MNAREEIAPRIVALRAEGLTWREIGERVGLALSTVQQYGTDPDGTRARARKAKYAGTCVDCGTATHGHNGRAAAPKRCGSCAPAHRFGLDPAETEATVALYRSGLSLREVGEVMGVSAHAVHARLVVAGEPRRPVGRPKATERAT